MINTGFPIRVHIELERNRDMGYQRQPSPQMDRFRALGIDRAVENAELQVLRLFWLYLVIMFIHIFSCYF